jgi:hypothetical protein
MSGKATDSNHRASNSKRTKTRVTSDTMSSSSSLPTLSDSPTQISITYLSVSLASLETIFKQSLEQPIKETVFLSPKLEHHKRLIKSMEGNDEKVPSSCRVKFQLTGSELTSTTTEFMMQ